MRRKRSVPQGVNSYRGETSFEVDGVHYFLVYGLKELAQLEEIWGCNRQPKDTAEEIVAKYEKFTSILDHPSFSDMPGLFRVGLRRWALESRNGGGPLEEPEVAAILERLPKGFAGARLLFFRAINNAVSDQQAREDQDPNVLLEPGISQNS